MATPDPRRKVLRFNGVFIMIRGEYQRERAFQEIGVAQSSRPYHHPGAPGDNRRGGASNDYFSIWAIMIAWPLLVRPGNVIEGSLGVVYASWSNSGPQENLNFSILCSRDRAVDRWRVRPPFRMRSPHGPTIGSKGINPIKDKPFR